MRHACIHLDGRIAQVSTTYTEIDGTQTHVVSDDVQPNTHWFDGNQTHLKTSLIHAASDAVADGHDKAVITLPDYIEQSYIFGADLSSPGTIAMTSEQPGEVQVSVNHPAHFPDTITVRFTETQDQKEERRASEIYEDSIRVIYGRYSQAQLLELTADYIDPESSDAVKQIALNARRWVQAVKDEVVRATTLIADHPDPDSIQPTWPEQ